MDFSAASTNRSLRTIKNELEYLCDMAVISPQQMQSIIAQLPATQSTLHGTISPTHVPTSNTPVEQFSNMDLKNHYSPVPTPAPLPPPAYPSGPVVLNVAIALYAYTPTDAGDLALQQNDRIAVLEEMNQDWWRGRNERSGLEGIFPRSYVRVTDEKRPLVSSPGGPNDYGNLPLAVATTGSAEQRKPSKLEERGKKYGRKFGEATIFGAGATLGSNIMNSLV